MQPNFDVITPARAQLEKGQLKLLRAELPAAWSGISNAMRRMKAQHLHFIVLESHFQQISEKKARSEGHSSDLGMNNFERGPTMIVRVLAYMLMALNRDELKDNGSTLDSKCTMLSLLYTN